MATHWIYHIPRNVSFIHYILHIHHKCLQSIIFISSDTKSCLVPCPVYTLLISCFLFHEGSPNRPSHFQFHFGIETVMKAMVTGGFPSPHRCGSLWYSKAVPSYSSALPHRVADGNFIWRASSGVSFGFIGVSYG